jgi:branched-chain amino acid transport system substrate-binding protein
MRSTRPFSLIVALALVATACSGTATPGPSTAPTAATATANATPIKVGLIEALTGSLASVGTDNQDGFNLYLSTINNTVAGRKIEVVPVDTQGLADLAVAKATQLATSDKVNVIAGVIQTPEAYALAGWLKQNPVPIAITGNAGAYDLFLNPQYKSPYLTRFTSNSLQMPGPLADFLVKGGKTKAVVIASDFAAGQQVTDTFGAAYVARGGQIVQELHPPLNTTDFGPYLTQMKFDADALIVFLPGADGARFGAAYGDYVGSSKIQVIDMFGFLTSGAGLTQLKDKALPFIGATFYSDAYQAPENQTFLKQFSDKYPGRFVSADVANGYSGAMVIVSALKAVNGNVEDTTKFLAALYAVDVATPRGPMKLDATHDVINNLFLYKLSKQGTGYQQTVLQSYLGVSTNYDMTAAELAKFPLGTLKGKWVGMTKDDLAKLKQ